MFSNPGANFPELFPDCNEIVKSFRTFVHVPQQSRGVKCCRDPHAILPGPFPMLPGDPEKGINHPLGSDSSQANNYLRLDEIILFLKLAYAGILLIRFRIPVPWRAAFDDIGNITVGFAAQIDNGEHIIQQHSRRAH